jgi:hypothetical protein
MVDTSTCCHTFGNNRLLPAEKNKITVPGERERERERTDRTNFATTVLAPKKNITKENRNRSSNFGN